MRIRADARNVLKLYFNYQGIQHSKKKLLQIFSGYPECEKKLPNRPIYGFGRILGSLAKGCIRIR